MYNSAGDQSLATLKLPFGILVLSWFLRNKTQKGCLTLGSGCPRDSDGKTCSGKGPELTHPSLTRVRYGRWAGSTQGRLAGSPCVPSFLGCLRRSACHLCSALPQLLVNPLSPWKSQISARLVQNHTYTQFYLSLKFSCLCEVPMYTY